ncbi:MAG: metallophosphoesterase [Armatimonadota bacterium]
MHTNDMHGTLTDEVFDALSALRKEVDLYVDSGDSIRTGNLGIPLGPDPVWAKFQELQLDVSVLGNRETHPIRAAFEKKIEGASHKIVVANMNQSDGISAYAGGFTLDVNDLRIGFFGVMVPMATEAKRDKALWAHRWTQPIPVAVECARQMRASVELLCAVTHIGHQRDIELARAAPEIDIIFGGHSHTFLQEPYREGNTYICQGGSHNRFAGVYQWENGVLTGGLRPLR